MPPEPAVTRWGKWIESTAYYANPNTIQTLVSAMEAIRDHELKKSKKVDLLNEIIGLLNDDQVCSLQIFVSS